MIRNYQDLLTFLIKFNVLAIEVTYFLSLYRLVRPIFSGLQPSSNTGWPEGLLYFSENLYEFELGWFWCNSIFIRNKKTMLYVLNTCIDICAIPLWEMKKINDQYFYNCYHLRDLKTLYHHSSIGVQTNRVKICRKFSNSNSINWFCMLNGINVFASWTTDEKRIIPARQQEVKRRREESDGKSGGC